MDTSARLNPERTTYLISKISRINLAKHLEGLRNYHPDNSKLRDQKLSPLCNDIVAEEGPKSPDHQPHNLNTIRNQVYQPLGPVYRKYGMYLPHTTTTDGHHSSSSGSNGDDSSDQFQDRDQSGTPVTSGNNSDTSDKHSKDTVRNHSSNPVFNDNSSSSAVTNSGQSNIQDRGSSSISVPNGQHTSVLVRTSNHSRPIGNHSDIPTPTSGGSASRDRHRSTPPTMMNAKRLGEIMVFFRGDLTQQEIETFRSSKYAEDTWKESTLIAKIKDIKTRLFETAMPIMLFLLRTQGFFPQPNSKAEDCPVFTTPNDRERFWLEAHYKHPALLIWWLAKCIGHVVNIEWYFQGKTEEDPVLQKHKDKMQISFRNRYIFTLDTIFLHILDVAKHPGWDFGWDPKAKRMVQEDYHEWSTLENADKDPIDDLCGYPEGEDPQIREKAPSKFIDMYKFRTDKKVKSEKSSETPHRSPAKNTEIETKGSGKRGEPTKMLIEIECLVKCVKTTRSGLAFGNTNENDVEVFVVYEEVEIWDETSEEEEEEDL